jgi:hypothetical protein
MSLAAHSAIVSRCLSLAALSIGLAACGGSSKPAEAPAAEKTAPPPKPEPKPEPEPAKPEGPKAHEVLSAPDKAWVLNFQSSEAFDKASATCDEKLKDKPQERAKCINKAREGIVADAMEFTKDDSGQDVWVVYRTKSAKLIKVYSVAIEYGEEKPEGLQVKKQGKGSGTAPIFADAQSFAVKLTSEYSLELSEPKYGRMAYDARLGFITVK